MAKPDPKCEYCQEFMAEEFHSFSEVTNVWHCECGAHLERHRGEYFDQTCSRCDREYNGFGQLLSKNWRELARMYGEY